MNEKRVPHPSWVEVNLGQFKKNVAAIKEHCKGSLFCLAIKANAYGHGITAIAKASVEAGVDYLAVAHLQEGIKLREANIGIPILVVGAIHEDQIVDLIHYNLEFTISSKFKADLVAKKCKELGRKCRVHLEVDTGMQRTGVRVETAPALFQHLKELSCFEIRGIYSHLAKADEPNDSFTKKQLNAFLTLLENPNFKGIPLIRHIANSGGTLFFPGSHLDMVRSSLITFGYLPENAPPALLRAVSPCFSLKTKISYFKVVEAGAGISYGHTYTTPKQTRIVTVPIGYGDGYRRSLSNRGSVLIRGRRFPIVGNICMDQFMVDIGDAEAYVGDEVVLIGKQGDEEISVKEIATMCDTIPYEVLCFFNDRLPRIYSH